MTGLEHIKGRVWVAREQIAAERHVWSLLSVDDASRAIYGHCAEPGSRRLDVRLAPISRLSTDDDASASLIKADGT
jgi:hypothetical protein